MKDSPNLALALAGDHVTVDAPDRGGQYRRVIFCYVRKVVDKADARVIYGTSVDASIGGTTYGPFEQFHALDCMGGCRAVEDCWAMSCASHVTHPETYVCDCLERCGRCGKKRQSEYAPCRCGMAWGED